MVKATAILAAAFLLTLVLRKRAAAERHLLWAVAIISAALLPMLSSILPEWRPAFAARVVASLPRLTTAAPDSRGARGPAVIFNAQSIETTQNVFEQAWPYVWIAGCIVCLFLAARGIIRQTRVGSQSRDISDGAAAAMLMKVAGQLRCNRMVWLRRSAKDCMPSTWGVIRPRLLLPASSEHWPDERLYVVIAHEMAHVQRTDWLFQMVTQVVCAAYWFNPLFWIAANQLHRESELACDDAVLRLGVDARNYATHLFEIARGFCESRAAWSPALAMARRSALEKRFVALLKPQPNRGGLGFKKAVIILVAALSLDPACGNARFENARRAVTHRGSVHHSSFI